MIPPHACESAKEGGVRGQSSPSPDFWIICRTGHHLTDGIPCGHVPGKEKDCLKKGKMPKRREALAAETAGIESTPEVLREYLI